MEEFRHACAVQLWRDAFGRAWYWIGWAGVADKKRIDSLKLRARRGLGL